MNCLARDQFCQFNYWTSLWFMTSIFCFLNLGKVIDQNLMTATVIYLNPNNLQKTIFVVSFRVLHFGCVSPKEHNFSVLSLTVSFKLFIWHDTSLINTLHLWAWNFSVSYYVCKQSLHTKCGAVSIAYLVIKLSLSDQQALKTV